MFKGFIIKYRRLFVNVAIPLLPILMVLYVAFSLGLHDVATLLLLVALALAIVIQVAGVRAMPREYVDIAKVIGIRRQKYLFQILLPWLRPYVGLAFLAISVVSWYTVAMAMIVTNIDISATLLSTAFLLLALNLTTLYLIRGLGQKA